MKDLKALDAVVLALFIVGIIMVVFLDRTPIQETPADQIAAVASEQDHPVDLAN
ncbi:MAG: hypothetical protein ACRBDX_01765 [Gammaproteobacteria bacterium]